MDKTASVMLQATTIALFVGAMHWVLEAKGRLLPKINGDGNFYDLKWQWRAVGAAGGLLFVAMAIWGWSSLPANRHGAAVVVTMLFVLDGLWLATGSVTTDHEGITKRGLWGSRSLAWSEIAEIRVHQNQRGTIELRARSQQLRIDHRINAFQHLLNEIENRTHLRSSACA